MQGIKENILRNDWQPLKHLPINVKLFYSTAISLGITGSIYSFLTFSDTSRGEDERLVSAILVFLSAQSLQAAQYSLRKYNNIVMPISNLDEIADIEHITKAPPTQPNEIELTELEDKRESIDSLKRGITIETPEEVKTIADSEHMPTQRIRRGSAILATTPTLSSLKFAENLAPVFFFTEIVALFVLSLRYEFKHGNFIPKSTLIGLLTGSLLHQLMLPWSLGGFRHWMDESRNIFAVIVLLMFTTFFLPPTNIQLFYSLSAILSGYNINASIENLWRRPLAPTKQLPESWGGSNLPSSWRKPELARLFLGASLTALSISLLFSMNTEKNSYQKWAHQLLSVTGFLLFTYDAGKKLAHRVPLRYYGPALAAVKYIMVPAASPRLSLLNFFGLSIAGLCTGLGNALFDYRDRNARIKMLERKESLTSILEESPLLHAAIANTNPKRRNDALLITGKGINNLIVNMLCFLVFIFGIIKLTQKNDTFPTSAAGFMGTAGMVLFGINFFMNRLKPSTYTTNKISLFNKILFKDSFLLMYAYKVGTAVSLEYYFNSDGSFIPTNDHEPSAQIHHIVAFFYGALFWVTTTSRFLNGTRYLRYVPTDEDVKTVEHAAIKKTGEITLPFNLINFINQNIPCNSNTVEIRKTKESKQNEAPKSRLSKLFSIWKDNRKLKASDEPTLKEHLITVGSGDQTVELHSEFTHNDWRFTTRLFNTEFLGVVVASAVYGFAVTKQVQHAIPTLGR